MANDDRFFAKLLQIRPFFELRQNALMHQIYLLILFFCHLILLLAERVKVTRADASEICLSFDLWLFLLSANENQCETNLLCMVSLAQMLYKFI